MRQRCRWSCIPRKPSATRPTSSEDTPSVYVVLREKAEGSRPIEVALVTASALRGGGLRARQRGDRRRRDHARAAGRAAGRVHGRAPRGGAVREAAARQSITSAEEHKFGQEPIDVLRERMRKSEDKGRGDE